ncbi:MAG: SpoIVB peptidase S55 domain-containing protein [Lachnospiraceae bacterium]
MEQVCEKNRKAYRNFLMVLLIAGIIGCITYYIYSVKNLIPDTINLNQNSVEKINFNLPFVGTIEQQILTDSTKKVSKAEDARNGCSEEYADAATTAYGRNVKAINVNLLDTININTGRSGSYSFEFKLFGIISLKKVQVNVCEEMLVIPCGIPVGIYIETDGVMVVDIGDITLEDGTTKCPASDIIWPGDYIVKVGSEKVRTKEELVTAISESQQRSPGYVIIGLYRDGRYQEVRILPVKTQDGSYKIGTWVRDDCQGLGTLTYIDSEGKFGALGHGISDVDTGKIVDICGGRLYCARIWSIVKGKSGAPGEVVGSINYDPSYFLGVIEKNTEIGIYGNCDENIYQYIDSYALPVGYKQEIDLGIAYIRSFIDGSIRDYEINITSIDTSNSNHNKGISFTVTDRELLESTGGIIQGM